MSWSVSQNSILILLWKIYVTVLVKRLLSFCYIVLRGTVLPFQAIPFVYYDDKMLATVELCMAELPWLMQQTLSSHVKFMHSNQIIATKYLLSVSKLTNSICISWNTSSSYLTLPPITRYCLCKCQAYITLIAVNCDMLICHYGGQSPREVWPLLYKVERGAKLK